MTDVLGRRDYPDFLAGIAYQDITTLVNTSVDQSTQFNSAMLDVSNWEGMQVRWGAMTNTQRLTIAWYVDQAKTILIGSRDWLGSTGDLLLQSLIHLGPWVQFQVNPPVPAGNYKSTIQALNVGRQLGKAYAAGLNELFAIHAKSVAGATTDTTEEGNLYGGPATVSVWTTAAVWEIRLEHLKIDGTWSRFYTIDNTVTGGRTNSIQIPNAHLRIQLQNNDAGAQTFYASVVFDPG